MKKMLRKKAGMGYFQIILLILSVISFSYLVGFPFRQTKINIVSADDYSDEVYNCCDSDCTDYLADECSENCAGNCLETSCENVGDCVKGCCISPFEGICTPNVGQQTCTSEGGDWVDDSNCNVERCNYGCCILTNNNEFTTRDRCTLLSQDEGINLDFRDSYNEVQCTLFTDSRDKGACVIPEQDALGNNIRNCERLTRQDCVDLTGSHLNFYENLLCSAPELNTTCVPSGNTTCLSEKDEVFFIDSCNNIANIYDSSKFTDSENYDEDYWTYEYAEEDSCFLESDFSNAAECGNCEFSGGSVCGSADDNVDYGDNICKDLNCDDAPWVVDAFGNVMETKDRKHGESWCVYDGKIGDGKDIVGSRHFVYTCFAGEVNVEACSDFRNEICVEQNMLEESEETEEELSYATCNKNQWKACLYFNTDEVDDGKTKCEEHPQCYWKNIYDYDIKGKTDKHVNLCLPKYPPGLSFGWGGVENPDLTEASSALCKIASFECSDIEVKECDILDWGTFGKYVQVAGKHCHGSRYKKAMNKWASSMGDCGAYVNINKDVTRYSGEGIDGLSQNYLDSLKDYAEPVSGQSAEFPDESSYNYDQFGAGSGDLSQGDIDELYEGQLDWLENTMGLGGLYTVGTYLLSGYMIQGAGMFSWKAFEGFMRGGTGWLGNFNTLISSVTIAYYSSLVINTLWDLGSTASTSVTTVGVATALTMSIVAWAGPATWSVGYITIWAIVIMAIMATIANLMACDNVHEDSYNFDSDIWTPPTGGDYCDLCNNNSLKPCSHYRCWSLGTACKFINPGTVNEKCVAAEDNNLPPQISPNSAEVEGYEYITFDNGFEIKTNEGCPNAWENIPIAIETSEPAVCRWDAEDKQNFEDFENSFTSYSTTNHTTYMQLPNPNVLPGEQEDFRIHIKCEDVFGDESQLSYVVETCIDPSDDKAPIIRGFVPSENNAYLKKDEDSINVTLFTNEPAECKWSLNDETYENMQENMSCDAHICKNKEDSELTNCVRTIQTTGGFRCFKEITGLDENNTVYFRCEDNPWEDPEDRNRNRESTTYEVGVTESPLLIETIEPSGDITTGTIVTTRKIKVKTSGGCCDGESFCRLSRDNQSWYGLIDQDTNPSIFESPPLSMTQGRQIYYIKCEDNAGNKAYGKTELDVHVDQKTPEVTRAYLQGGSLNIVTDEDSECVYSHDSCFYTFENGTDMSGILKEHTTSMDSTKKYYIKCKDLYNNLPDKCSIIIEGK